MADKKKSGDEPAEKHEPADKHENDGDPNDVGPHHENAAKGHDAHRGPGGHGDTHAPNIREYMVIFVVLAVLTFVEVGVTRPELHIAAKAMTIALVGLALTKAAIVALYYMHLKHETKVLKITVAIPMAAPTIYALVLISEAAWRLTR